jgi:dTDP-4-amino-4,6-dideoxygalactose transaminase
MGMPCDMPAILELAARHRLAVIEDAACAIGSELDAGNGWERIGKPHGDIACFSFHPRKVITTGEGGMLTTNKPEWDRQLRLLRQHCMSVPDTKRHSASEVIFEAYPKVGYNYRMTDIQAAVGCEQLKRLPEIVAARQSLARRYREILAGIPELGLPAESEWARSNWQSYCVRLPPGCDQKSVMQHMLDAGVATRRGIMCSHREAAYPPGSWSCGTAPGGCECPAGTCERLRQSEQAQDQTIILPLFPQMAVEQQDQVALALQRALTA